MGLASSRKAKKPSEPGLRHPRQLRATGAGLALVFVIRQHPSRHGYERRWSERLRARCPSPFGSGQARSAVGSRHLGGRCIRRPRSGRPARSGLRAVQAEPSGQPPGRSAAIARSTDRPGIIGQVDTQVTRFAHDQMGHSRSCQDWLKDELMRHCHGMTTVWPELSLQNFGPWPRAA